MKPKKIGNVSLYRILNNKISNLNKKNEDLENDIKGLEKENMEYHVFVDTLLNLISKNFPDISKDFDVYIAEKTKNTTPYILTADDVLNYLILPIHKMHN